MTASGALIPFEAPACAASPTAWPHFVESLRSRVPRGREPGSAPRSHWSRLMPDLPNGTVTLVFTDVEGSTQLVRQLGDAYPQLLGDHRRLLREAVEEAQGHVVDHRGDEFFMVFDDPCRAAEAVTSAQWAFATHLWPEGVELRVRMGLHTGKPTFREGAYYGLDVHRAARIAQAGSGGQILLSQQTRDELGRSFELEDLGEHELPGPAEPA